MAADNELENLKTDCITALRKGDEDAFDAAALKFQPEICSLKWKRSGCWPAWR